MGKVFFQNGKGLRFIIAAPVGFVNAYMVVGNCQKRQNLEVVLQGRVFCARETCFEKVPSYACSIARFML